MPISTVGSGLDVPAIAKQLADADVQVARMRLVRKDAQLNTELSAIGQIKASLSKLQSSLENLMKLDKFYTMKSNNSDPDFVGVSLTNKALAGNYDLEIEKLAQRHSLASSPYASADAVVGQGTLTIQLGKYTSNDTVFTPNADVDTLNINITAGNDSLAAIRDAINNSNGKVSASIIQDNGGARLAIVSKETGEDYALKVTVTDADSNHTDSSGLSALVYDPTTNHKNMTETMAAQNSLIKLNGLTLSHQSNKLTDVIDGITLDLKKAEDGKMIRLTVDDNKAQLGAQVNQFIKDYNDAVNTITALTGYNPDTKKSGALQGDGGIRTLKLNLSKLVTESQDHVSGAIRALADIGVKTNQKGLLQLDQDQYNKAVDNHYKDIGQIFADAEGGVKGMASKLNDLLDDYLGTDGTLTERTKQLEKSGRDLINENDKLNVKWESLERRYRQRFSALDSLLVQMQGTMDYMTQQMANLPQLTRRR